MIKINDLPIKTVDLPLFYRLIIFYFPRNKPVTSLLLGTLGLLGSFPIGALMLIIIGALLVFVMGLAAMPGTLFLVTLGTFMLTVVAPAMCCVGIAMFFWKIYLMCLGFIAAMRRLIYEFKQTSYDCLATVVPAPVLVLLNITPPTVYTQRN